MTTERKWVSFCRALADDARFQTLILIIILFNAALVGLETDPEIRVEYGAAFTLANQVILTVFVAELAIRIGATGGRVVAFLKDGWNVFDTLVILVSLLPGVGAFATIGRIARVLRVARLVSVSPKLRLIVDTMMRSIPSLGHVTLLLSLLLYIYAVIGVNLFAAHDPAHWSSLGRGLLTLFQMLTLEGWVEIQAASSPAGAWVWIYFSSFVVLAVFVVVNLFIAVVLNNLDELREEERLVTQQAAERARAALDPLGFADHLGAVRAELERLEAIYRRETSNLAPQARVVSDR